MRVSIFALKRTDDRPHPCEDRHCVDMTIANDTGYTLGVLDLIAVWLEYLLK